MKNKKYELLKDNAITPFGRTLYRIKATTDFGNVKKGELGGYIEKEENLSHLGNAWVSGNARVSDDAWVSDNARVSGNARVSELGDVIVFKNHWSSGRYFTYTKSNKMWKVGCFYGTGAELIAKAYKDSEVSGNYYKSYVNLVLELEKIDG